METSSYAISVFDCIYSYPSNSVLYILLMRSNDCLAN